MSIAPEGPDAQLTREVLAAIQDREWDRLESLTDLDVAVEVRSAPGIQATRNEHVWRARSLRGRAELRAYLVELREAAPALACQPLASSRVGDRAVVRTECAGVDSAGSPFDAVADFSVWTRDGLVERLEADITDLSVGEVVIRHGDGDPRRYFQTFLG
jgi:hypothetical protein